MYGFMKQSIKNVFPSSRNVFVNAQNKKIQKMTN